ncbi:MAG: hypothetical protein HQL97_05470 [Magnetococcales bacterium]|nr:hypothetical protein [Magnetococcales bacterium]
MAVAPHTRHRDTDRLHTDHRSDENDYDSWKPFPLSAILMRDYLITLIRIPLIVIPPCMIIAMWSGLSCLDKGNWCELVRYQFHKIDHLSDKSSIIFLGDSSIGNALDSRLFTELSGKQTVNLALTGSNFNIPGMYNLLHHITRTNTSINTVIFALSPLTHEINRRTLGNDQAWQGVLRTLKNDPELLIHYIETYSLLIILLNLFREATSFENFSAALFLPFSDQHTIRDFPNDYVPQDTIKRSVGAAQIRKPFQASKRFHPSLHAIGEKCRQHHLRCIYLHAPFAEDFARSSHEALQTINQAVLSHGLTLATPEAIAIPAAEIGDRRNHIAPEFKQAYTRKIFEILKGHLRSE